MTVLYWICLSLIAFSLVGYGALWIVLARLMSQRAPAPEVPQKATVLIAARNEVAEVGGGVLAPSATRRHVAGKDAGE